MEKEVSEENLTDLGISNINKPKKICGDIVLLTKKGDTLRSRKDITFGNRNEVKK